MKLQRTIKQLRLAAVCFFGQHFLLWVEPSNKRLNMAV